MNKKTSKRESFPNDMIKQAALTSATKQQKKCAFAANRIQLERWHVEEKEKQSSIFVVFIIDKNNEQIIQKR